MRICVTDDFRTNWNSHSNPLIHSSTLQTQSLSLVDWRAIILKIHISKSIRNATSHNKTAVETEFITTAQTASTEDLSTGNGNSGFGKGILYILAGLFILAILSAIVGCIVLR
ncbi:unnamed protein product [Schistosoma margrebowiei]|uniref:Uncharacterized protein n=1 Tax=Schistosoma margrebowiei TaxID=48269 RepID=A0A183MGQ5_9TREM|nr:unnamed protein product [Schistosoma margrebowiei]